MIWGEVTQSLVETSEDKEDVFVSNMSDTWRIYQLL